MAVIEQDGTFVDDPAFGDTVSAELVAQAFPVTVLYPLLAELHPAGNTATAVESGTGVDIDTTVLQGVPVVMLYPESDVQP